MFARIQDWCMQISTALKMLLRVPRAHEYVVKPPSCHIGHLVSLFTTGELFDAGWATLFYNASTYKAEVKSTVLNVMNFRHDLCKGRNNLMLSIRIYAWLFLNGKGRLNRQGWREVGAAGREVTFFFFLCAEQYMIQVTPHTAGEPFILTYLSLLHLCLPLIFRLCYLSS